MCIRDRLIEEGKKQNPELMAIVFSGYDDFEYARRALKLGVQDYLTKPINMDELTHLASDCVKRFEMCIRDSPRTLEEVGKQFSVTRERIRQIEAKALRKLRHPSRSKKLKDYLDE